MKCPSCGCENREGAKFCGDCAALLAEALVCAKCGTANPKGRKFCDSCGNRIGDVANRAQPPDPRSYTPKHLAEKILRSRSALEGERKQVTVLFADLKGSMDLGEKVDPEEWYRIMDRFFQILSDGVHRLEGTVDKFTGDGIMAIFGAPIAHEDSWPSSSRHLATHSLSVDASISTRAFGRFPSTAANRSRSVWILRSSRTSAPTTQTWLFTLCTSMPILSMAGLHLLAALTAS
jgi:Double zinc ribbon/Adenylate and Guanylate cyclase catalytic domain